jgi:predicted enzyme related to lactoylglutathione lyase
MTKFLSDLVYLKLREYSAKVEQLGSKVISPKMPVRGMGHFAVCTDSENNDFGIFEVDQAAK